MKKNLWFAALALAAMTSCSNDEVLDVAENRAIEFKSFVNNNARAVVEVGTEDLNAYYVFGNYKSSTGGEYLGQVFNNELQTTPYYWVADNTYSFGAYANGNGGKIDTNVSYEASDNGGTLTFTDYEANDGNDLVAAVATAACTEVANQGLVNLSFKHLLSQVKFTFSTTDADSYKLTISDLKVHAATKGKCTYNGTATWESTKADTEFYEYVSIEDVSQSADNKTAATDFKLVIPQDGTDQLKVTFTATIADNAGFSETAEFEGTLAVSANIAGDNSLANTWMPGYRYNYTATINGSEILPDGEMKKIEFNATVEAWNDATEDQPANPEKQENTQQ